MQPPCRNNSLPAAASSLGSNAAIGAASTVLTATLAALLSSSAPLSYAVLLRPLHPPLHPPTSPLPSMPGQPQQHEAQEPDMSLTFTLGRLLNLGNSEAAPRTGETRRAGPGSQGGGLHFQLGIDGLVQAATAAAAGPQHSRRGLSQADIGAGVASRRVGSRHSRAGPHGQSRQSQHLAPATAATTTGGSPQRSRPLTQAEIEEGIASRRVQPSPRRGRAVTPQPQRRGTPQQAQPEDRGADLPRQQQAHRPEQRQLRSFASVAVAPALVSGPGTVLQPAVALSTLR